MVVDAEARERERCVEAPGDDRALREILSFAGTRRSQLAHIASLELRSVTPGDIDQQIAAAAGRSFRFVARYCQKYDVTDIGAIVAKYPTRRDQPLPDEPMAILSMNEASDLLYVAKPDDPSLIYAVQVDSVELDYQ